MVTASIMRFILVLPVPVTALSHTTEIDMSSIPVVTMRNTGMASAIKLSDKRNTESSSPANTLNRINMITAELKLSFMIL